ncbi:MAG: ABC transporter permease [Candidatus Melainabacteria bacterium]|nr:ABC transporter permease [Candidatus Melainabacteria bacterium]
MSLAIYILKRVAQALPTVLAVSIIGFFLMRYHIALGPIEIPTASGPIRLLERVELKQPIDPLADLRQNPQISPQALAKEEERLGLDQPLLVQYWRWLTHFIQLDLGQTNKGENVATLLASRSGNTLLLNLLSMLVTWGLAIPLGVYAAIYWRSAADRLLTLFSSIGMAFPGFVLALILAMLAVQTGWFPVGGLTSSHFSSLSFPEQLLDMAHHLVLPVAVLGFSGIAGLMRQMRGNLLDVLQAEYVKTARAKGLPEWLVIYKHAVRNAINPLVTMLGYELAAMLSGTVLIETVLNYPGLGFLTYQAAIQGDANLVMASLVLSCLMLIVGNLLADLLLHWVDPRVGLA